MIDFLYSLPDLFLVSASGVLAALLIILLPQLVHAIPGLRPNPENTDFALRLQGTLFTMTALVVAFTLVEANSNFRKVDALISNEASNINSLDRLLTRYGSESTKAIRPLVRAYAQSIVNVEWPEMLRGERSDRTRLVYSEASRAILAIEPKPGRESLIYAEILKALEAVSEARDVRLDAVLVALPAIYWEVVMFSILIVLFAGSTIERSVFRSTLLALQTGVLGAFVGFVFVMDNPLKGQTAIGPDAIVKTIAVIDRRDR